MQSAKFVTIKVEEHDARRGGVRVLEQMGVPYVGADYAAASKVTETWIPFKQFCRAKKIGSPRHTFSSQDIERTFIAWSPELEELIGVPLSEIDRLRAEVSRLEKANTKLISQRSQRESDISNKSLFARIKYIFTDVL